MAPPPPLAFSNLRRLFSAAAAAPTPESVLYTLRSLSKEPSKALAFFRKSEAAGHPLGSAAYNLMLRALASHPPSAQSHFWPFLRDMADAGYSIDQGTYLAALAAFKRSSRAADYASLTAHYAKSQEEAKAGTPISAAADAHQISNGAI
uniref:Pentacotripeptide-repeat region of PRORP domain-containing protein n=1 Tax=Leersia perrieri TaxID=77586 RepID=A0A0D9VAT8_9ORYZ